MRSSLIVVVMLVCVVFASALVALLLLGSNLYRCWDWGSEELITCCCNYCSVFCSCCAAPVRIQFIPLLGLGESRIYYLLLSCSVLFLLLFCCAAPVAADICCDGVVAARSA